MPVTVASLVARLELDKRGFDKGLKNSTGLLGKFSGVLGTGVVGAAGLAAGALAGVGAAAAAVGAEALNQAQEFEKATNAIIRGTGASGKALADMEDITKQLRKGTAGLNRDFEELGSVVAEVNTRTGLTGKQLQDFSDDILILSRLTGEDALTSVRNVTRAMGDWGIETENSAILMDKLHGAGQAFGIGLGDLTTSLVKFGAPMRQMGFTIDEAIVLFGQFEKAGVNADLVMSSLRIAAGRFAEENVPLQQGLNDTIEAIKNAATESEALSIAMETFGTRAGADMAAAIREGKFELEEAMEALEGTAGGLDDAAKRATTLAESWNLVKNNLSLALLPIGQIAASNLEEFFTKLLPVLDIFNEEIERNLLPSLKSMDGSLMRIEVLLGLTDGALRPVNLALGILWQGFFQVSEIIRSAADSLEFITTKITSATAKFNSLGNSLKGLRGKLPSWLKPGSPTPLELGIRGISDSLNKIPDFGEAFSVGGAITTPVGGGAGNITINMGGQAFNFSNDTNGQNQALMTVLRLMRTQLEQG